MPVLVNAKQNTSTDILTFNTYHLFRKICLARVESTKQRSLLAYLAVILIKTSNDINLNPGPESTVYPCGTCGCPNYSTLCYSLILSTSNHYSVLSDTSLTSPTSSKNMRPLHASTPDKNKNRKPSKKSAQTQILSLEPKHGNCSGGGVLVAIKDTYITTAVPELQTDCEIVWCKLELIGHKAIYLSSYYNPKTSNENGYLELEKSLTRANNIKNALIIMAGDFNLPGWDWKTKSLKPNTQHTNIHHKFTDILDDHGLQQMVEEPTRESNTLDLIITNYPNCFNRVETISGISDHDIVFAELNTIPSKQTQKPRKISLYQINKY
ncbi:unnamed protein product [Mytilus edulis]|uniref:Endonuclease/exonuclease/phosphatase domain-containing protein n=1 Tax=Mytilus edulis TaxID=6550 RepID=A0A8S3RAI4_MYTED|nr:unnamed protein product [Mytilus edulis]